MSPEKKTGWEPASAKTAPSGGQENSSGSSGPRNTHRSGAGSAPDAGPGSGAELLVGRSFPYFAISLLSNLSLFTFLAWALLDLVNSLGSAFSVTLWTLILLGMILSVEDYLVSIFAMRSRENAGGRIREYALVALFLYGYSISIQFFSGPPVTAVPRLPAIFTMAWGLLYWFSHGGVFFRFTSRIDISRLLESRRGEKLTRMLKAEHLFVRGAYRMMLATKRNASFRTFLIIIIVILYSCEIFPLPPAFQILGILSILAQLNLGYTSRMYSEDHRYLAWGALPNQNQRRIRSGLMTGMLITAAVLALPFARSHSLIAPSGIIDLLTGLFDNIHIREAAKHLNRLSFLNQPGDYLPPTQDFTGGEPGSQALWFMAFLHNIGRAALVLLGVYLLILPLLRDPRIISRLMQALRSSSMRDALRHIGQLISLWFRGFWTNIGAIILFPFRAMLQLIKGGRRHRRRKREVQSEGEQRTILKNVVNRQRTRVVRSPEREQELNSLSEIFTTLVLLSRRYGLEICKSNTVREITVNCETILSDELNNSESETITLSSWDRNRLAEEIHFIGVLFEESLFSLHLIGEENIEKARAQMKEIRKLFLE